MKICVKCQKNPRAWKTQAYCKACAADYMKEWRKNNPDRARALSKKSYLKYHDRRVEGAAKYYKENTEKIHRAAALSRATKRRLIDGIKTGAPCSDCGGCFPPVAMDFDHVSGVKRFCIARVGGSQMSVETLLEEIAKCELVCSNCHRVRTQKRGRGRFNENPSKSNDIR